MFKVMIVDDDVPMMKYVAKLIDWDALELTVVGTASSGSGALDLFHQYRPDLVITDIDMPQMDGIELVSRLQELKPDLKVIFLTFHEEFQYARKAVQLDAQDYLIKDELTAEQLIATLKKTIQSLEADKDRFEELTYKQDVLKHQETWKEQFWIQLLAGASGNQLQSQGVRLGIEWRHPHFVLAIGEPQYESFLRKYRYGDVPILFYAISNIIKELAIDSLPITTFIDKATRLVCIANFQNTLSLNTVQVFREQLELVNHKITDYLKFSMNFKIASMFKEIENIPKEYNFLLQTERMLFYETNDIISNDLSSKSTIWNSDVSGIIGREWSKLEEAIKNDDRANIDTCLSSIETNARKHYLEPNELLLKSSQWMRHLELQCNQSSDEIFHQCLVNCNNWTQSMVLISHRVYFLMSCQARTWIEKNPKLQLIDQYITDHMSESISLIDIANYLFLNPSYFSRYFKQETGLNFTDYMHQFKMKIACKLLKEKVYTTEAIGLMLGYVERSYFSKVFKKYIGVSPKDYRESN